MTKNKPLPNGLRLGHDESVACKHRDLSVCPVCAAAFAPDLVDVYGQHFWVPDPAERALLHPLADCAEDELAAQGMRRVGREDGGAVYVETGYGPGTERLAC
jgi:hypothetical protein